MKKKFLVATAVVAFGLLSAGSAFAYGFGMQGGQAGKGARGGMGAGFGYAQTMSAEVKGKLDEARKIHAEIFTELRKENPDKNRARDLHNRAVAIMREARDARFKEMLKNPPKAQNFGMRAGGRRGGGVFMNAAQEQEFVQIRRDMAAEFAKDKPDTAKLNALHAKLEKIRAERSNARFEEMLKDPAKFFSERGGRGRRASF